MTASGGGAQSQGGRAVAPNLELLELVARRQRDGKACHAIFGLDLHDLDHSRCIWVECPGAELSEEALIGICKAVGMRITPPQQACRVPERPARCRDSG